MRPSGVEEKRPWATRASFDFIPGLTLSEHPFEQRKGLFMKKLMGIMECKSLHPTEFEGYTIKERFMRMGWENLLSFNCDKIYTGVVKQWMASLSRNGDELIGIVDGKSYTITPRIIRDLLGVDTRTDLAYIRYKEVDSKADTAETKIRWNEACKTVFGREENVKIKAKQGYKISMMTPLAKVLWRIGVSTFLSRDYLLTGSIYPHEIHLLHALLTGDYLYSFAHLMIHEIWDMYEQQHREYIPYGNYISEILYRLGAVSEDEYVKVIPPMWRVISVKSFFTLEFLKSPTEHIIYDRKMQQRITFPNAGTGKAPPQPKPTNQFSQTYQYMPPQTPIPNANVEIDQQSSIFQKQYDEMKTMVTNIQKQMECQVLAERREQEREKLAKEREKLAENREKQAEEREKQAEIRDKEGEKRAEERERWAKERERLADEREKRAEEREKQSEIRDKEGEKRAEEREKWAKERERQAYERGKRAEEREKQSELRDKEREKQAEEREKWAKERERQADEREKRAEERERQSEIRDKEGEKRAEERENRVKKRERQADEREKQAELWTHAIIWDIERQRYFYEMEQQQLRMAWNQLNGANAVDEFQIPQMSHTSLHPPQEGSPYYDPTQGDEIPKAFQPLYQDIYGPRRKKPFSA